MRFELVVVNETATKFIAVTVVVIVAETAVHGGTHGIAGASHRGVAALAVREVERNVRTEVDGVARIHLPLEAEVTAKVVGFVECHREGVAVAGRVVENVLTAGA